MSTDTAFALGLLALVARGLPDRVRIFLLTVVVVDDLVALPAIATVYMAPGCARPLLALGLFGSMLLLRTGAGPLRACCISCSAPRHGSPCRPPESSRSC